MKKLGIGLIAIAAALAITPSALADSSCYGVAGNIVANCGFETGDTTGWSVSGYTDFSGIASATNNGNYSFGFGATEGDTVLSQSLSTTSGTDYTLTFWLWDAGGDGPDSNTDFQALWDGTSLLDQYTTTNGYTEFTYTVAGTGSDTLTFEGMNAPSYYFLDDVSLTPGSITPEPSSFLLLGTGLLGLAGLFFRRRFAGL